MKACISMAMLCAVIRVCLSGLLDMQYETLDKSIVKAKVQPSKDVEINFVLIKEAK